jgi:hypothetical protein
LLRQTCGRFSAREELSNEGITNRVPEDTESVGLSPGDSRTGEPTKNNARITRGLGSRLDIEEDYVENKTIS